MFLVLFLLLLGLFFLSLLLKYPHKKLFDRKPSPKHVPYFHLLGWVFCLASLYVATQIFGIAIGITYWFGFVTLLALGLVVFFALFSK